MKRLPAAILFACNFNRVRSPMAEGLMRSLYGDRVYVDSCGLAPGEGLDPLAQAVMAEIGVDVSTHVSQTFDDLDPEAFDLVVAFTNEARSKAEVMAQGVATQVEFWPLRDPTLVEGSRQTVLEAYREARDIIVARLKERFGPGASLAQRSMVD